jgi:hypothetical protein
MQVNTSVAGRVEISAHKRSERDFNLCHLSEEQRQIAAIDTEVCFWLWLKQAGKVLHTDIVRVLSRMDKPLAAQYRDRLNYWRDDFRSSPAAAKRFADISESTWGRLLGSFKKQTARFNG